MQLLSSDLLNNVQVIVEEAHSDHQLSEGLVSGPGRHCTHVTERWALGARSCHVRVTEQLAPSAFAQALEAIRIKRQLLYGVQATHDLFPRLVAAP